jgi:Fic family protein
MKGMDVGKVRHPPKVDLSDLLLNQPDLLQLFRRPELAAILQQVNDKYVHWDKFRWLPLPEDLSHRTIWAYIRFQRNLNQRPVPLLDKQGQPFSYWLPDRVLRILNQIDRWSGETILSDQPGLPSRERYVISSLMEEAIASSQLEGAATTRQIAKEMLRSGRRPRNHHEQMIYNNWETIQYLRLNKNMKLSPETLCEIHAMITDKTLKDQSDAGRVRTSDDVYVYYRDEITHIPPPASQLQKRIQDFCDFANNDDEHQWIHPVIKATILHFWLGYDHPFVDGNGRTARAIFYWYLLSRGYWLFEYLSISRNFLKAPSQYHTAYLYTETDSGDLTYFIMYNLRVTHISFRDLHEYLQRKQEELVGANELLRRYQGLNDRQRAVIAHALRHPDAEYTVNKHKIAHGVVYQSARTDLLDLVERGLLKKELRGKAYIFSPSEKIISQLNT